MKPEGWFVLILVQLTLGWIFWNQYLDKVVQILIPYASGEQVFVAYIAINVGATALSECIFSDEEIIIIQEDKYGSD